MRKWEEIVKDKLEGYESPLPEGHLADFRARREKADKHRRRFPWVGAVAVAVAASLAALFFLWKPAVPEEDVRVAEGDVRVMEGDVRVMEGDVRVAEVTPDVSAAPSRPRPLLARADAKTSTEEKTPVDAKKPAEEAPVTDILQTTAPPQAPPSPQTTAPPKAAGEPAAGADAETVTLASPFIPQATPARPVRLNVGAAAGIVAGGGLLAGVLTPLVGRSVSVQNPVSNNYTNGGPTPPTTDPGPDSTNGSQGGQGGTNGSQGGPDSTNGGQGSQGGQGGQGGTEPGTVPGTNPSIGKADGTDVLQEAATHYFPLKLGLSAWIPLTERLQITTGVQYSLYSSRIAGELRQNAHYLGIPVRLDWTFAQSRWLDVYLGGGVEGAFCAGATLGGQRISGDGFSLSLLGAGGIQFNMSRHVGLYAEPQISWRIPMGTPVLQTYRSTHPLMFSVETGIRINLK